MPASKDRVYRAENLRFATKSSGREPTLYFRTSHGSGRLRQQHKSGPLVQDIRKHTSHAFFPDKPTQKKFSKQFKRSGMTRSEFREIRRALGGRHTPTPGFHHFEASFDSHSGSGVSVVTHRSKGKVVMPSTLESLRGRTTSIYARTSRNMEEYLRRGRKG